MTGPETTSPTTRSRPRTSSRRRSWRTPSSRRSPSTACAACTDARPPGRGLGAEPVGVAAARALRGARLRLRDAQAQLPQVADAGGRRPPPRRRRRRRGRPARRRGARGRARPRTSPPSAPSPPAASSARGRRHDDRGGATPGRPARRPVRVRPRRPHLPDVGAHVRLQPRVRALPVVVGAPRPARALDRRVQGADRRVRADAGLLRQHRRRRADRAPGLLGAARLRRRAPRRREVLDQRLPDHPRARRTARGHRLRRRPDLPRRRDGRGQRRGARARARTTPPCAPWPTSRPPA